MKICFYNATASFLHGGLETYCWEVGHALARRGHEVTIVAGEGGPARQPDVGLVTFPIRREPEWLDIGTRFQRFMERMSLARRALPHLLAAHYDAIVINKPFDFPALWWARRRGLRAQVAFRSGGTESYPLDRFFSRAVDHWISTSRYNADQVEAHYHRPVTVIHNGVDTALFSPGAREPDWRRGHGVPDNALLVLSVGRLVGWKGQRVIIEAIAELPAAHYALVGDGPEKSVLAGLAQRLGIAGRVHFIGGVKHGELPRILRQADLFVQPSIGEESFGISVVEAMACELPVLASRNGGLVEIVSDGATGRLLPVGDVAAWRAAIADLDTDRDALRRMGVAARARAEAEFTWAANARKLEQVLNTGVTQCAAS